MDVYVYDSDYLTRLKDRWNEQSFPIISNLLRDALKPRLPGHILDFGAGTGAYAQVLREFAIEVTGCDISEEAVARCKGKYASFFRVQDSSVLPADTFDTIFSTEVLEHIKDYENTLHQFYLALRSPGLVVLTTTAYATSVFTMLYRAKRAGVRPLSILGECCDWLAGYFSEKRRGRFVAKWCFEPLGGHYHGFRKGALKQAFCRAGFSVLEARVFYAMEPIQIPFLYSHNLRGLLKREDWSTSKRWFGGMIYLVAHPLNSVCKRFGLFANNVCIVAQKGSR